MDEVKILKKMVKTQSQAQEEMLSYLIQSENQRGNRYSSQSGGGMNGMSMSGYDAQVQTPPELRRASELLSSVGPEDQEFERLARLFQQASPTLMFSQAPGQALVSPTLFDNTSVYPLGHDIGIDPLHSDHINKIPYHLPVSNIDSGLGQAATAGPARAKSPSMWRAKKPRILLVEDDKICSKIGSKFLSQLGCSVEVAVGPTDPVGRTIC